MRLARPFLVSLTAVALVACTGGEDEPMPIGQRFVTSADAPGSQADPEEGRETTQGLEEFVSVFSQHLIDADPEEMTAVFEDAGVRRAGSDARFFGDTHGPEAPHLFSWFVELGSEDGATSAIDYFEADSMKPCPGSCATVVTDFAVDDIPDARGVKRLATAEAVEAAGNPGEHPTEDYWIGFTVGSNAYTVLLVGPPGSVTEEQARSIASAYYERLTGD